MAVIVGVGRHQRLRSNERRAGAGAALHALFDREWEWELTQDPLWASYLGDRRWNDKWPDISAAALAAVRRTGRRC